MTKIQKARTIAKESEKTGTEHTRVRIVELREKVVFTSLFEICIYSFL